MRRALTRPVPRTLQLLASVALPSAPFAHVFHCHILEHEDNDMMRPCEVL